MSANELATTEPPRFGSAEAAALLGAVTVQDDRFRAFKLAEVVQAHPRRIVARGFLNDREVYLKLFNVSDGSERVRSARAEYWRAAREMGRGKLRVARHVASAPRLKLIAVEGIKGTQFDVAVEQAAPERHRELHRLAADWLRHFARQSVAVEAFDPHRFLSTVAGLANDGPDDGPDAGPDDGTAAVSRPWVNKLLGPQDAARRDALRRWIVRTATAAGGRPVSVAATHDDFSPRNLALTPRGALVGYDLGRLFRCPVADAAAIFLVIQQLRQLHAPAERRMGLNIDYVEGFRESELLGEEEFSALFPLYVAHKFDIMFNRHATRPDWLGRLRPAVDAFLDEFDG